MVHNNGKGKSEDLTLQLVNKDLSKSSASFVILMVAMHHNVREE